MSAGRVVLNKHYNDSSQITRDKFYNGGEIIISNEPGFEAIYLINARNEVVKISCVAISGSTTPDEIKDFLRENYLTSAQTVEYVTAVERFLNERISVISAATADAITDEHISELAAMEVAKIVDSADSRYDTLREIAEWIINDTTGAAQMANDIAEVSAATVENADELSTLRDYIDEQIQNIQRNGDHVCLTRAQYDELLRTGSAIIDGKMTYYSDYIYYCIYESDSPSPSGEPIYVISGNVISFSNDVTESGGFLTINAEVEDGFINLDNAVSPSIPDRELVIDEDGNVEIEALIDENDMLDLNGYSLQIIE